MVTKKAFDESSKGRVVALILAGLPLVQLVLLQPGKTVSERVHHFAGGLWRQGLHLRACRTPLVTFPVLHCGIHHHLGILGTSGPQAIGCLRYSRD